MPVREFFVVEPPTGAEVQDRLADAIRHGGVLSLVLQPDQDLPSPSATPISFHIRQTTHPREGGFQIGGENEDYKQIYVRTTPDLSEPATVSIVTK